MIAERRLEKIREEVLKLHDVAKRSVEICLEGLRGNDEIRRKLEDLEMEADIIHSDIDYDCVTFIALFQPVARDLRFVVGMMKTSSGYERITDLALEVGYYYCYDEELLSLFEEMRKNLLEMFKVLEDSYAGSEVGIVHMLKRHDNVVDECYEKAIVYLKNKCKVEPVLVARHLERMGDILGKIGSTVVFIESGKRIWIK
ncbi:phosphate signaling complex PhoU family protein [Archaeoglobus profundus]|uniref:Phosphate uptake regulator, PhoU n=1 Tax=Archaeoglobus profundus (strain DSM 5631 / JCM 9629 / NBRC 100127 / Av18) TaxID=572546 RepID=D2RFU8_ARCPA|nr:PhoU domain-containing protein [Archaeoglobus profundus]ADB57173.1 phosphate uptake regulator, PhoU [Archaeoglobus profundus DSM 5631]